MTDAETAAADTDGPPHPRGSNREPAPRRSALRLVGRTIRSLIRALFIVFLLFGLLIGGWGGWLYYTGSAPGLPEVRDTLARYDVSIPLWVPAEIRNALQPPPAVTETTETLPVDDGNGTETSTVESTTAPDEPVTANAVPGQAPEIQHETAPVPGTASTAPNNASPDPAVPALPETTPTVVQPAMPTHPLAQQPDTLLPDGLVLPPSRNEQNLALLVDTRLRPIEERLERIARDFARDLESHQVETRNMVASIAEELQPLRDRLSELDTRLSFLETRLPAVDNEMTGFTAHIESTDTKVEAALAEARQLRDLTQQEINAMHNIVGGLRRHVLTIGQSVNALTSEFYLSRSYVQTQADPGAPLDTVTPPTAGYSFGPVGQRQYSDSHQVPGQAPAPLVITNTTHTARQLPFGTHRIGDYIEGYGTILAITRDADGEHLTTERGVIFIPSSEPEPLPQPDTANVDR